MRIVDFFDGAQSETTPTIGNIVASNLIQYADDASYEAAESGAPTTGNIYYNTTINQIRYYNGTSWITLIDATTAQTMDSKTLTNSTIDADNNTITNIGNDEIKAAAGIDASKIADSTISNAEFQHLNNVSSNIQTQLDNKQNTSEKGVANGYAGLDGTGKVPSAQLPAFVDDVEEYANFASLPVTGETGKIYVTLDDNKTYRWTGSVYVEIGGGGAGVGGGVRLTGGGNKNWTDPGNFNTTSLSTTGTAGENASVAFNATYFGQIDNVTAAVWLKTSSGVGLQTVFGQSHITPNRIKWWIGVNAGKVATQVSFSGSGNDIWHETTANYNDSQWHLAVMTYSVANGLRLYVDGVLITGGALNIVVNNAPSTLANNTTDPITFNSILTSGAPSFIFNGKSDEPTWWSVEMNGTEVTELWNTGNVFDYTTHSQAANLQEWWRHGDGDTAPTLTGQVNSQNGSLAGSATYDNTDAPPAAGGAPGVFTFSSPIQVVIEGLANADNNLPITESPISFPTDGDVAYVTLNEATGGPNLAITVDSPDNVPDGDTIIMFREGDELKYSGVAESYPLSAGGGATVLNDLTDVDTTTTAPVTNDYFVYDGSLWVPRTKSVVHAYRAGSLIINGSGALVTVIPDNEVVDVNNDFNTGTGTFVAPRAGLYRVTFSATFTWTPIVGVFTIIGRINANVPADSYHTVYVGNASTNPDIEITTILNLALGNTIQFQLSQNSGINQTMLGGSAVTYVTIEEL